MKYKKKFEEYKKSDANIHQMQEDLHYMDTKIKEKEANIKRTLNEAKIILKQKKREEEMMACEVNECQKKLSELEKAELLSKRYTCNILFLVSFFFKLQYIFL